MRSRLVRPGFLAGLLGLTLLVAPVSGFAAETPEADLRQLLESGAPLILGGRAIDPALVESFYRGRDFHLAWDGREGQVEELRAALAAVRDDGIKMAFPVLPEAELGDAAGIAQRDLLLSETALRLASALAIGRVQPQGWEDDWAIAPRPFDVAGELDRALADNRLGTWLAGLAPRHEYYRSLKAALTRYRALAAAGGWKPVPRGRPLKPGMSDNRVSAIRERLLAEGDLSADRAAVPDDAHGALILAAAPAATEAASDASPAVPAATDGEDLYGPLLEVAVRDFQSRHGIVPDGVLGPRTVEAMNVPVRARIEQILLNLERWRSLPRDFGRDYVLVNVPGESLDVVAAGKPVLHMKVVVGDPQHPTPVVRTRITAVTFNPIWRVPLSIGKNEILPKVKADPRYLEKNQMVMKGSYVFEQLPGPKNALGQLKFDTPNKFDVYLHDTATHGSFLHVARALSHGCVRVEDARSLAAYVLDSRKWPEAEIDRAIQSGETQKVAVARHLPVELLYITAFVDPDGTVEFRDDIYGRDKRLRAALHGDVPPPALANVKPKPGVS